MRELVIAAVTALAPAGPVVARRISTRRALAGTNTTLQELRV
jgi:hypothetical protein